WEDSQKQNGMSPVQYMDKIGLLGPDVVGAHCIFVDEADWKTLAQKKVGCVHNPSSNMMIASGVSPVAEMRAAGIAVGLGTDGPAGSNNDLDLMEEIDLAAKLAKIRNTIRWRSMRKQWSRWRRLMAHEPCIWTKKLDR